MLKMISLYRKLKMIEFFPIKKTTKMSNWENSQSIENHPINVKLKRKRISFLELTKM